MKTRSGVQRRPLVPVDFYKCYQSDSENLFAELARKASWKVTKKGWPDFICYHEDGRIMMVEVKASQYHRLSSAQQILFNALERLGLDVRRWSPDVPMDL
jgi:hypothetical protein